MRKYHIIACIAALGLGILTQGSRGAAPGPGQIVADGDYTRIEVRGTLWTGNMRETDTFNRREMSRICISSPRGRFRPGWLEVEFPGGAEARATARRLDRQKVIVRGALENRKQEGMEDPPLIVIPDRWVIAGTEVVPAPASTPRK